MIFKQWQQIPNGNKTQTRRPIKNGEQLWFMQRNALTLGSIFRGGKDQIPTVVIRYKYQPYRIKWQVGRTYAIQPGRGKRGIGRIQLLGIRSEPLQDIDGFDCLAEGLSAYDDQGVPKTELDLIEEYAQLWHNIYHGLPGCSWEDNPEVWVLEFEIVEGEES